jgi:hypothetical protein
LVFSAYLPTRMDRPFYRAMQESQFLTFLTRATRALCYKGPARAIVLQDSG